MSYQTFCSPVHPFQTDCTPTSIIHIFASSKLPDGRTIFSFEISKKSVKWGPVRANVASRVEKCLLKTDPPWFGTRAIFGLCTVSVDRKDRSAGASRRVGRGAAERKIGPVYTSRTQPRVVRVWDTHFQLPTSLVAIF